MPLNFSKPILRNPIISKIKQTFLQSINLAFQFIRPEILLVVFLIVAILLAFAKIEAIGFYVVFAIFITGYFCERIVKVQNKGQKRE